MSVYTNQTNINATERFDDGSGPNTNFTNINVSSINFTTPTGGSITSYAPVQNAPGGVLVGSLTALESLTAQGLWFGNDNYTSAQYAQSYLTKTGLGTQGRSTGTNYPNVIQFNSQVANTGNDTISMFRVSTIGVAVGSGANGQQINMVALASTLANVYPSIVS